MLYPSRLDSLKIALANLQKIGNEKFTLSNCKILLHDKIIYFYRESKYIESKKPLLRGDNLWDKRYQISINTKDFEISRFAHDYYDGNSCTGNTTCTSINYEFNFYSGIPEYGDFIIDTSTSWLPSYIQQTFTISDLYYQRRSFTNSFFKLDFYDTKNGVNQINYFTVIIPTSQGETTEVSLSEYLPPQKIKKPIMLQSEKFKEV